MSGVPQPTRPRFLWQAVLIVLPVIVLTAIGWMSLRQDRLLAQSEAKDRAQVIADDLAFRLWNEWITNHSADTQAISFRVGDAGQLLFPPKFSPLPKPVPLDTSELTPEQLRLWRASSYEEFLHSNPPENFAGAACYNRGLQLVAEQKLPEAVEMFGRILERYPEAKGESGISLATLAQFQLFEWGPYPAHSGGSLRARAINHHSAGSARRNGMTEVSYAMPLNYFVSVDSFCSNIVSHPTALTPYFFNLFQVRADEAKRIQTEDKEAVPGRIVTLSNGRVRAGRDSADRPIGGGQAQRLESDEEIAALAKWKSIWEEHEAERELFSAARQHFPISTNLLRPTVDLVNDTNSVEADKTGTAGVSTGEKRIGLPENLSTRCFWFNTPDGREPFTNGVFHFVDRHWLAVSFEESKTSRWVVCHSESEIGSRLGDLTGNTRQVPDYFGVGLEIAGRRVAAFAPDLQPWHYEQKPGGKWAGGFNQIRTGGSSGFLASAAQFDNGVELLKVSVYLTSPSALFVHQRARAFWFGLVIAASTIAAIVGLITAYRVFQRQLRLNEMKSNFVSSVSHELRAPIASVRLMAESLDRGKVREPEKQSEYFRFIVQECRRLSSLIENVLDFSRIEQGRKQYEFEPTDLGELLKQTVTLMEPYAEEKNVHLSFDSSAPSLHTAHLEVEVDGRAIQQALVNLIDNAIKHSPRGEAVVLGLEVGMKKSGAGFGPGSSQSNDALPGLEPDDSDISEKHDQNSCVCLSVADHGPGIPSEEREKIFERFYRLGSELRRETQGVGIGLSIVKHIVEAHGGRVLVESEVGRGSRFIIELPLTNRTTDEHR